MNTSYQQKFTQGLKAHTDRHMVLKLIAKFGNNEAFVVNLPRATVSYKEKIRLCTRYQLYDPRKTFAIGSRAAQLAELFRRGSAQALV